MNEQQQKTEAKNSDTQKQKGASKKLRKRLCIAGVVLIGWWLIFDPFKVTDPSAEGFDPYKFKFTDYTQEELPSIFKRLFHEGSDRGFVENVLVSSGGASIYKGEDTVRYSWKLPLLYLRKGGIPAVGFYEGTPGIMFLYDENDKARAAQSLVGGGFNEEIINKLREEQRMRIQGQSDGGLNDK